VKPVIEAREFERLVLAGADDPLPSKYCWFEGDGYWIYAAEQPPTTWRENTFDCAQVCVGLDYRAYVEWGTGSRVARREGSGNGIAIFPPNEPHRALWQRRAILVSIWLSKPFLAITAERVLQKTSFDLESVHIMRDPLIEELASALYREYEKRDLYKLFADSVVTVLATYLLRNYTITEELSDSSGGLGPARTRRVRSYIEQSLEHDLSIGKLAKVAGLSPQYFAEMFRQTTGFTPHKYVSQRRVERARQLLIETDLPLAEVAHRCGFTSQSQFTTVFQRLTDVTPGRFRAEHADKALLPGTKDSALSASASGNGSTRTIRSTPRPAESRR
jgi:AraC family transcriptional regulator